VKESQEENQERIFYLDVMIENNKYTSKQLLNKVRDIKIDKA
jgi:hypothetical protein